MRRARAERLQPASLAAALVVLAAAVLPTALDAQGVLVGALSREAHGLAGEVYALNDHTLQIRQFDYDGLGPAATFWLDRGASASPSGVQPRDIPGCARPSRLPAARDDVFTVELPDGSTLADWGYLSVWCAAVDESFGGVRIDAAALVGVPDEDPVCTRPVSTPPPDAEVEIGQLSDLASHGVSGTVYAVNSRTLRIKNLRYDGEGPAALFWVGSGNVNSDGQGVPFRSDCNIDTSLPEYNDQTVELELPAGLTLDNIDYLSIWCETFTVDFGSVRIDASALSGVPQLASPSCGGDQQPGEGGEEPFPVQSGWNCEALSDDFQVRWLVNGDDVDFELVGRIGTERYMGFGPSGNDNNTDMLLSDVAIAYQNGEDFKAVDFHITSRQPCSAGKGVCPDEDLTPTAGTNDFSNVSGKSEGDLTSIRYTRSLAAADSIADRPISTTGPTFVSWANGPLNPSTFLPLFHQGGTNYPQGDVSIEFGRSPKNECRNMLIIKDEEADIPGFLRPTISNVTEITARIGPPGGSRGYAGITGGPSWGFAWYMSPTGSEGEDVIIPAIAVERGKTYNFTVQGGRDDGSEKAFHPLYITDSAMGGYLSRTPQERAQETVYAGVDNIVTDADGGVTSFNATATGALCAISSSLDGDTASLKTWEDYAATLNNSCAKDPATQSNSGKLVWTVPEDAPDLLYYQCITHPFLGFKLVVFDEGKVDATRLEAASGGGEFTANGEKDCRVVFNGQEKSFAGCQKELSDGVEVYWTLREADGEIDTLFRAPTRGGYVGFGWGYSSMVGSNVAIAYEGADGAAKIDDYFLRAQNSAGVQPGGNQGFTDTDAAIDGDFVAGMFTRKLAVAGLPTITNGSTEAIWAVGSMPSSATSLTRHGSRASGTIDLSATSGSATVDSGGLLTQAYFIAHAVLMIIAWLVLTPSAVVIMKYLKGYNPTSFQAHRGLNSASVLLVLIAFIMALVRGSRTQKVHLGLGSAAFALAILQAAGGILRPGKGTVARKPWYIGHAAFGHTALYLAMANALVGMILYDAGIGWIIVWGILVGAYVVANLVLFSVQSRLPQEAAPEEKMADE